MSAVRLLLCWNGDVDLLHRVRDFGEDAWGELARSGLGEASMQEIDAATDNFTVSVKKKRKVGVVTELLVRVLRRHNLENDVRIQKAND